MITSYQLENVPCPLGCAIADEFVITGRDRQHGLPGYFSVVKCRNCGLMRTNPRPTPNTIGFFYPDDYGPYLGTRIRQLVQKKASLPRRVLQALANRLIEYNNSRLPDIPKGAMLEVGCASGLFMHQMADQGWRVDGIEFSKKAASAVSQAGYRVYAGPLEIAPMPGQPVDLIVGWMVIEHLHDPVGGLKKLHQWCKPDGWLVLSLPNAASFEFGLFKDKWYALHLPNHLYHYTPESITQVLRTTGWTVVKVHHQRVLTNLVISIGYVLMDKGYIKLGEKFTRFPQNAGRWHQLLYPLAWLLSFWGQTGRMTIWARRDP